MRAFEVRRTLGLDSWSWPGASTGADFLTHTQQEMDIRTGQGLPDIRARGRTVLEVNLTMGTSAAPEVDVLDSPIISLGYFIIFVRAQCNLVPYNVRR